MKNKHQDKEVMVRRIVLGFIVMPFAFLALGFIVGIIPGLLLGLIGWQDSGAVIIPILWAYGHVKQRARNRGDVGWPTFCVAVLGGAGAAFSIWLFGNITS